MKTKPILGLPPKQQMKALLWMFFRPSVFVFGALAFILVGIRAAGMVG